MGCSGSKLAENGVSKTISPKSRATVISPKIIIHKASSGNYYDNGAVVSASNAGCNREAPSSVGQEVCDDVSSPRHVGCQQTGRPGGADPAAQTGRPVAEKLDGGREAGGNAVPDTDGKMNNGEAIIEDRTAAVAAVTAAESSAEPGQGEVIIANSSTDNLQGSPPVIGPTETGEETQPSQDLEYSPEVYDCKGGEEEEEVLETEDDSETTEAESSGSGNASMAVSTPEPTDEEDVIVVPLEGDPTVLAEDGSNSIVCGARRSSSLGSMSRYSVEKKESAVSVQNKSASAEPDSTSACFDDISASRTNESTHHICASSSCSTVTSALNHGDSEVKADKAGEEEEEEAGLTTSCCEVEAVGFGPITTDKRSEDGRRFVECCKDDFGHEQLGDNEQTTCAKDVLETEGLFALTALTGRLSDEMVDSGCRGTAEEEEEASGSRLANDWQDGVWKATTIGSTLSGQTIDQDTLLLPSELHSRIQSAPSTASAAQQQELQQDVASRNFEYVADRFCADMAATSLTSSLHASFNHDDDDVVRTDSRCS